MYPPFYLCFQISFENIFILYFVLFYIKLCIIKLQIFVRNSNIYLYMLVLIKFIYFDLVNSIYQNYFLYNIKKKLIIDKLITIQW